MGSDRPFVVGLTGGIASGKSTVGRLFEALGVPRIDADQVARDVVKPGQPALAAIVRHFGPDALLDDGTLNRAWLRKRVFSNPEERGWLERLLHPLIHSTILNWINHQRAPYVILESPLLLEGKQRELVDWVLVIDVPEATQLERALARDACSADTVRAMMAAQSSRSFRCEQADDIICNTGTLEQLEHAVRARHQAYLEKSRSHR